MSSDKTRTDRILVVDDNEMNRDMLMRRLERYNYSVDVAENGERALEMMRAADFDLVMLDIMMPVMNGYQVLETMKADTKLCDIPVIMISAVDDLESVVKCIELGAEDYLFKPFNPVLLKARIGASLDKRRHSVKPALNTIAQDLTELAGTSLDNTQQAIVQRIQTKLKSLL